MGAAKLVHGTLRGSRGLAPLRRDGLSSGESAGKPDLPTQEKFFFFRVKHSVVRVQGQATEKCKAGQQRPPATENARPNTRTNAGHEKTEARRNEAPPTRRGSGSPTTTHPTAADPPTTTREAHAKWGSGPTNCTQALDKNVLCRFQLCYVLLFGVCNSFMRIW